MNKKTNVMRKKVRFFNNSNNHDKNLILEVTQESSLSMNHMLSYKKFIYPTDLYRNKTMI